MIKEICNNRESFYSIFKGMDEKGRVLFRTRNNEYDLTYIAEKPEFYLILEKDELYKLNYNFQVIEILNNDDVLRYIDLYVKEKKQDRFPFMGGFIGCVGYDTISKYEKTLIFRNYDEIKCPDLILGYYKKFFVFDEIEKMGYKVILDKELDEDNEIFVELKNKKESSILNRKEKNEFKSNYSKEEFCNLVEKAKEKIIAGDIFQIVLSQRIKAKTDKTNFEIYESLEKINLSSYMYCFDFKDFSVIGSSPEVLVSVNNEICKTNPIAGTRKRGSVSDKELITELKNDEKECAEHLMLVDLGRNDIGRICEFESVKVTEFMVGKVFSHVVHLCSTVEGRLKEKTKPSDVIKTMLPVGTVSGAPKIKAMEIIEVLENRKRGLYSGGVGFISLNGNIDMAIAIRTLIIKNKDVYLQAGAGIVYDSIPENEYYETLNKMKVLMEVI
ncbi:MAG: anthranilate synthase component I family protein [Sarcina sp.]